MTDVLEISKLISELFSLLLLQEASVSLLRLMSSDVSLPLRAMICIAKKRYLLDPITGRLNEILLKRLEQGVIRTRSCQD